MWFYLALLSAFFLGIYDILKKTSLNNNAVLPVLMLSISTSALICVPIILLSKFGIINSHHLLYTPEISKIEHFQIFLKSIIVLSSWIFSFFALKHLPITIVTPIRATGPLWTLIGAILIFSEKLNTLQWLGILVTLLFFYLFSTTGKKEGLKLKSNKWFWFIILATLTGAVSGLYDKHLMQSINRMAVQTWFSIYQVALMVPIILILWWPKRKTSTPFTFRWSIPLVGIVLLIADFVYFYALSNPDALISVISSLRRGSVIIAFSIGAILFREKNIKQKSFYLAGIITGIALLLLGSAN